jgi:hypothetical protein
MITRRRAHISGMTDTSQVGMLQGDRSYSYDANMALSDGFAAITASGYAQYGGADGVVDLGGNQQAIVTLPSIADVPTITPQQARIDAVCVIDLTGLTNTGTAKFILVGSNDAAFGTGNTVQLAMMEIGAVAGQEQPNGKLTPTPPAIGGSRYELLFTNEQANVKYQFAKLYVVIASAANPTFKAFIAVLPEP